VEIPISAIPKELWPDNWYENAYWQYSKAVTREEIGKFFEDREEEISEDLAVKLAQYIADTDRQHTAQHQTVQPSKSHEHDVKPKEGVIKDGKVIAREPKKKSSKL
jgi:hypothetical protein